MNKQNVVHTYSVILISNKKEWTTDSYNNMDKSQMHCDKWRKPDKKNVLKWSHLYNMLENLKLSDRVGGRLRDGFQLFGDGTVLGLDCGSGYMTMCVRLCSVMSNSAAP